MTGPHRPRLGQPHASKSHAEVATVENRSAGTAAHVPEAQRSATSRRVRLDLAAAARGVPLPTILVTVAVVVGVYLLGRLAYRLREVLLLIFIASFLALILNPLVVLLQQHGLRRRGPAVGVVLGTGLLIFLGLAAAFGHPLVNGLTHLSRQLPQQVADAQHGRGVVGRLVEHFHLRHWVEARAPQLQDLGGKLAGPALAFGKGAAVIVAELLAVFTMVVLLLLEGPRMRDGLLSLLSREQADWCRHVGTEMRYAVVGYVFGDLLTSVIAGVVVGLTMAALGLPFPLLWGLWVALVDFLPQIGGALAGIPTVLFALLQSLHAGIVMAIVFLAYQQLENHVLNPVIMSRTVRTSPLLIFMAVLIGGSIGSWVGGAFGAFAGALLAVPSAACLQILMRELWQLTATEPEQERQRRPNLAASSAGSLHADGRSIRHPESARTRVRQSPSPPGTAPGRNGHTSERRRSR
ncbi:MAG TPA: AI-2E family transporter [Frankiaceae bacterium]|nr:AI-2E family transporter [Frankiaceae bacterium]